MTDAGRDGLAAELYLLAPGRYAWRLDGADAGGKLQVAGPRSRIAFTLPPRRPCTLSVRKAS